MGDNLDASQEITSLHLDHTSPQERHNKLVQALQMALGNTPDDTITHGEIKALMDTFQSEHDQIRQWLESNKARVSEDTQQQLSELQQEAAGGEHIQTGSLHSILESGDKQTEMFQIENNPKVFFLDFVSMSEQEAMLGRIASFVEGAGNKQKIFSGEEQEKNAQHFKGHDYRASDLTLFFNTATTQGIELTQDEEKLKKILVEQGFMQAGKDGKFVMLEPEKALLSTLEDKENPDTNSNSPEKRYTTIRHELSHGEFFTNKAYEKACFDFFDQLPPNIQEIFSTGLKNLGYNTDDKYLLVNEFQAYLWEEEGAGPFLNISLIKAGVKGGLVGIREQFLGYIDAQNPPVTNFFQDPELRKKMPPSGTQMSFGKE